MLSFIDEMKLKNHMNKTMNKLFEWNKNKNISVFAYNCNQNRKQIDLLIGMHDEHINDFYITAYSKTEDLSKYFKNENCVLFVHTTNFNNKNSVVHHIKKLSTFIKVDQDDDKDIFVVFVDSDIREVDDVINYLNNIIVKYIVDMRKKYTNNTMLRLNVVN